VAIIDSAIVAAANDPIPSHIPADDIPPDIPTNDISSNVSPGNRAPIEMASAVHPMERAPVHSGEAAAPESAATAKASASPRIGLGQKDSTTYQNRAEENQ
jgi:hypothetical protein